jgi:hypothetical protein
MKWSQWKDPRFFGACMVLVFMLGGLALADCPEVTIHILRKHLYGRRHSWAKCKKTANTKIEKFVKLTDHSTCACNDLTNFVYEVYLITGNGNYVNELKFVKFVKSQQVNLIFGGF